MEIPHNLNIDSLEHNAVPTWKFTRNYLVKLFSRSLLHLIFFTIQRTLPNTVYVQFLPSPRGLLSYTGQDLVKLYTVHQAVNLYCIRMEVSPLRMFDLN